MAVGGALLVEQARAGVVGDPNLKNREVNKNENLSTCCRNRQSH
jgi:hypothetical protein